MVWAWEGGDESPRAGPHLRCSEWGSELPEISPPDFLFRWHQATPCPGAVPLYHLRHGEYSVLL